MTGGAFYTMAFSTLFCPRLYAGCSSYDLPLIYWTCSAFHIVGKIILSSLSLVADVPSFDAAHGTPLPVLDAILLLVFNGVPYVGAALRRAERYYFYSGICAFS